MRTALLTTATALLIFASEGAQARSAAPQLSSTCTTGLERVAARPADLVRCCEGQLRCAEFLSTTTIMRTRRERRT
jgi:hypothetical protein